jgi:hypothetical protein
MSKTELEGRVLKSLIDGNGDYFECGYDIMKPKVLLSRIQHGDGERWGSSNFPNGVFTAAIECDLQGYCGEEEEDLEEGAMLFVCADAGTGKVDDVDTWQAACAYVEISCHDIIHETALVTLFDGKKEGTF